MERGIILYRNQSKETTKKKYELMLSDYLNNNEKRLSKDVPRDRVESKIKKFKEFINVKEFNHCLERGQQ